MAKRHYPSARSPPTTYGYPGIFRRRRALRRARRRDCVETGASMSMVQTRLSRWTRTRRAAGDSCFLANEQSWRTAWRARSLLSRTNQEQRDRSGRLGRSRECSIDKGGTAPRRSVPVLAQLRAQVAGLLLQAMGEARPRRAAHQWGSPKNRLMGASVDASAGRPAAMTVALYIDELGTPETVEGVPAVAQVCAGDGEEVFERARVLERAPVDRIEARVADQLLRKRAGVVVRGERGCQVPASCSSILS